MSINVFTKHPRNMYRAYITYVPRASAHIGKWGQLTPWKMDEKLKSENMQKEQFSMFVLYFESNQGRQV